MTTCESYRGRLLDHAYGLLDADDAWPMATHLRDCGACRAALDKSVGLIASASKSPHPNVTFTPPAPKSVPAPDPRAGGPRTVREVGLRWAVAASLLLAASALGGPGLRDLAVTAWYRGAVDESFAKAAAAANESNRLAAALTAERARLAADTATARRVHQEAATAWTAAESLAAKARADRPFALDVEGPATALVGAPNVYRLKVSGPKVKPVKFVATVAGPDGTPLFTQTAEATEATVTLPASLWAKLPAGTTPTLTVSATDGDRAGDADRATVTESIRLGEPQAATMLVTDKPLYRPGERVYYRSLTLDRATFTPLEREANLRFVIEAPDGQVVNGSAVVGLAKPIRNNAPVPGPDGKPVRGVGTGVFELPASLPGGEYTLKVYGVGTVNLQPAPGDKPLAVRKFLVNRYVPDKLLKTLELDGRTYGPGDAVRAKVTVRDQGKPVAATLQVTVKATVSGVATDVPLGVNPTATDAAGDAAVLFTLPKGDLADATLSVRVTANGVVETITKPVPLATRRLTVEFFPEGGDLIAGVPNRVYFRATTPAGKPADLTGTLSDGTPVKTLTDADRPGVNQGLGVFTLTPALGRADFLSLSTPTGIEPPTPQGFPLPAAKPTGVVLSVPAGVSKPGEALVVRLTGVSPARRSVLVGAYTRGRAMAHARVTLDPAAPTDVALDFGGAKLGGVTRVTVFDAPNQDGDRGELKPIAERLVFRTPGERLTITAATQQAAGASFLPGAPVELTVTTADETGAPKPAILWAAVVNRFTLTMADDRSARLLPTHFLLAGEVQKPDELEQADFLLTDHPKAATALDLVLGTQGWRRFAEQAPGEFAKRVGTEDSERLLLAMGGNARPVGGFGVASLRLAETHLPRYESAANALAAAESAQRDEAPLRGLTTEYSRSQGAATDAKNRFLADGQEYAVYQDKIDNRLGWLPLTVSVLFVLAFTLLKVRSLTRDRWPAAERRWLRRGGVGFALLGLFALAVAVVTYRPYGQWRVAASPNRVREFFTTAPVSTQPAPSIAATPSYNPPVRPDFGPGTGKVFPPRPLPVPTTGPLAGRGTVLLREGAALGDPVGPGFLPPPRGFPPGQIFEKNGVTGLRASFDRVPARGDLDSRQRVRDALPPEPTLLVREYANSRTKPDAKPSDLPAETVLWQPLLVTPADGRATLRFDLADGVSGYQVLVAGHTLDGRLGASVTTIEVRQPFAVDLKLPAEIGSADRLSVPVVLTNATGGAVRADLAAVVTNATTNGLPKSLDVPVNGGTRALLSLTPTVADGVAEVAVTATPWPRGPAGSETVRRGVTVVPDGYPVEGSASGLLTKSVTLPLALPKGYTPGTLHASVVAYPNALAEVRGGLDGLLREPNGCFEQASSANYPNVLALNLLRETGHASPGASRHAKGLLDRGYAKLVGFECPKAGGEKVGFEWFGAADRPHDALTAYGLVQFTDMARVYPVDAKLLARTRQFLLDARDGKGGYRPPTAGLDSVGRAPPTTVAAYITWAITQSEADAPAPTDLAKELDALLARAAAGNPEANDPFFLSLTASSLLARNRAADGVKLLEAVVKLQRSSGEVGGVPTSLTQSSGKSLAVEATAAAALAWFRAERPDLFAVPLRSALAWLHAQRDPSGAFGATHSTVLALKAFTEEARRAKRPAAAGELVVRVNGVEVGRKAFTTADAGPIAVPVLESVLVGVTAVTVESTAGEGTPVSLSWHARTATPANAPDTPLTLTTTLDRAEVSEGDTVRVTAVLTNATAQPVGMAMAIVGLPAGLRLPPDFKQLKALTERPATGEPRASHFEVTPREVIFYRRALAANESVTLVFDAVAETPGTSRGPASRAYPYYAPEFKNWATPLSVSVK